LMSDNKIYGMPGSCGNHFMHVINSPDSVASLCNLQQHIITLPTYNWAAFPNYPNYRLGKLTGSLCDTLSAGIVDEKPLQFKLLGNPVLSDLKFTSSERLKQCSVYDML